MTTESINNNLFLFILLTSNFKYCLQGNYVQIHAHGFRVIMISDA